MAFEDLKEYGTEAAVKAAGKQRQQGKTCKSTLKSQVMMTLMYRRGSRWRYLLLEVWSVDGRVGSYIVCKHCILHLHWVQRLDDVLTRLNSNEKWTAVSQRLFDYAKDRRPCFLLTSLMDQDARRRSLVEGKMYSSTALYIHVFWLTLMIISESTSTIISTSTTHALKSP